MRGSLFKQIKLSKLNHSKIQKTAQKGLFCSLQSNQAPAIVYGQRVNCFEVTVCRQLSFSATSKRLKRKIFVQKENKTAKLKMKKEKKTLTIIT